MPPQTSSVAGVFPQGSGGWSTSAQTVWFPLAVLLVIGELVTGTFYLLMVAIGLITSGLAALIGFAFPAQAIVAAIAAVFDAVGLQRTHYGRITYESTARNRDANLDIDETLRADAWPPERCARVQYRGAVRDVELAPDAPATVSGFRIVRVRGNMSVVTPKQHTTRGQGNQQVQPRRSYV